MVLEFCTLTAMPSAPRHRSHNAHQAPVARAAPTRWRSGREARGPLGDIDTRQDILNLWVGVWNICLECRFRHF